MFIIEAVSELDTVVLVETDGGPVWFSDTLTSGRSFDRNAESTHMRMGTTVELGSRLCSQDSISNRRDCSSNSEHIFGEKLLVIIYKNLNSYQAI